MERRKIFFIRLVKKRSEYWMYSRAFLGDMAGKDELGRRDPGS